MSDLDLNPNIKALYNRANLPVYSIYDSVRRKSIILTFQPPEEQYGINTNFEFTQLTGRGGQVASYGGTDSQTIQITFDAVQGYLPTGYVNIDDYLSDLKALAYKESNNVASQSPECELRLGLNTYIGYINSVNINKSGPFDKFGRRLKASISISFTEKDETSRTAKMTNGAFAASVQSLRKLTQGY